MKQREEWGTRIGFILAAVGSAIGLGNIWRFPYMAYENGGGAFLIPYFVAVLTAGIPLLILEFGVGQKYSGSAPSTFRSIAKKWEWLGWWQVLVAFVISIYYVAVIGWAISYLFFSFDLGWGTDTKDFFFNSYLNLTGSPFETGGIQWPIFGAVTAAWIITWGVLLAGVKKGIEAANKIFMPVLFIMVIVIMGRALFLPGAIDGVEWMFKPDFSKLLDTKVWTAAYGQVFFTLSIGFAIMITYASYLPKDSDINNNACMTTFINCGFSMIAGIMIFSVLGYMAAQQGVGVDEVVSSGVGLAFITIPQAINFLPAPILMGTLFFTSLVFAGLSSQISICEACVSSIIDKFGFQRKTTVTAFCLTGFLASIIFTTGSGLLVLDIVDHFINNFGILFAGLMEMVLLSWFFKLETVRGHVNKVSDFTVGSWWVFCIKIVTPLILGYIAIDNLIGDIQNMYGGYTINSLITFGWAVVILLPLAAMAVPLLKREEV